MDKIKIIPMTIDEAKQYGVNDWSSWECEPSVFEWEYSEQEAAYVYEGDVIVTSDYETVNITAGMMVSFPKGLKCTWEVKRTIKKAYCFNYEIKE